ncbi:MAG: hypothetical protein N3B18_11220, partial [Desulfobacterota bacterium]|nr:hypothetical protein [Thermodesulfobacteriota bacterium]
TVGSVWRFTTRAIGGECLAERVVGNDPEALTLLRRFRDEVLAATEEGRALINLYYGVSPWLVTLLDRNPERITALQTEFQRRTSSLKNFLKGEHPDYTAITKEAYRLLRTYFPEYKLEHTLQN